MQPRLLRALTAIPIAALLVTFQPAASTVSATTLDYAHMTTIQKRSLSGFAALELTGQDTANQAKATNYFPKQDDGCPGTIGDNIKQNQDCLNLTDPNLQGRAQAHNETSIAIDPSNTQRILGSGNDYRRGDGNCYGAFSRDDGRTWADTTIPMSFTRGAAFNAAREYWTSGGDTAVAFDTKGNAYFDCQVFQRGPFVTPGTDASSAVYLFRSTQNGGASWNFPGRPVIETADLLGTNPVTGTGAAGGQPFQDKPYMTVDNHVGSPFQDRIYVAWTEYDSDGSAYIWEKYSSDYGEHFSNRVLVSATSEFCTNTFGAGTVEGNCNENSFADPFTGPDGALYIAYQNYNNQPVGGTDNRYQILLAKSTNGGQTFTPPVKVSDFYDLPDCDTYQGPGADPGRSCVVEKAATRNSVFRATNYPAGQVNPLNPSQVVVTLGSYINRFSNESNGCVPTGFAADGNPTYTGVKTPGACNNKILISISNNGGGVFTGSAADPRTEPTVNQDPGQATTDQWWQWAAFTKDGKFAVSYYDRQYGNDETAGFSDVSLSGSGDLVNFGIKRVTSSSMPPPTQFNGQFLGDYSGLAAATDAHPLWMDTRNPDLFACPGVSPPSVCTGTTADGRLLNTQDLYTATEGVPSK
jgi:hypothetical protein